MSEEQKRKRKKGREEKRRRKGLAAYNHWAQIKFQGEQNIVFL